MDSILDDLGGIIKKQMSDVVREPLPGFINSASFILKASVTKQAARGAPIWARNRRRRNALRLYETPRQTPLRCACDSSFG